MSFRSIICFVTVVCFLSFCYMQLDPPSVREVFNSFCEDPLISLSRGLTNVAWFWLDYVPYIFGRIYDTYVYLSEITLESLIDSLFCFVVELPDRFRSWFVSLFACPRQRTFFFFWSYPQSYYCTWYNEHYGMWRELSDLDAYILATVFGFSSLGAAYVYVMYLMALRAVRPWEDLAHFVSSWLYGYKYHIELDFEHCRQTFRNAIIPVRAAVRSHGHGICAATRSTASAFIHNVVEALGHKSWIYQMSRNDQEKGYKGLRTPFWPKDLTTAPRNDPIEPNSAVVMTDVDYYVDMHRWLSSNFTLHFFYTFQPYTAGRVAEDYSYFFVDNKVNYFVTGSAEPYIHPVWNFQVDNISVTRRLFGIPIARATYHVERRFAGGDHEIVMLLPLRQWKWWNAWLACEFVGETPLRYFEPKVGNFNRVITHKRVDPGEENDLIISTATEGSCHAVAIPGRYDEELHNTSELGHNVLAYPTVQMTLSGHGINDGPGSKTLTRFNRSKLVGGERKAVVPTVFNYQFPGKRYDPDAKNSMVPFMDPLALPACAPKQCYENESAMIEDRVTKVLNPMGKPITLFIDNCINEFVACFIPADLQHTFHPVDMDYVREKQKRPSQRRIIDNSEFDQSDRPTLQTFMKKEPKTDTKAPRNITQYEGDTKVSYSMYMYTLAEYLKTMDWYAFGKTPERIATKIAEIAQRAENLVPSDGRTFDAHLDDGSRVLEARILTAMFALEHHARLHKLHGKQFARAARTTLGVIYDMLNSRGSGSPETANFNSILNKFIAFVANRLKNPDAPAIDAYNAPGDYGGDDGISADISAALLRKAASMMGQDYAAVDVKKGESFSFLSRRYSPQVWYGRLDSVCDLERSLRGFNVTVSLPANVTPIMKLVEKSRAYYLSDSCTPIIGELASAVVIVSGTALVPPDPDLTPMVSYNSRLDADVQYPNDIYPDDHEWVGVPPGFDQTKFRTWLRDVLESPCGREAKLAKLLHPPYCDARSPPTTSPKDVVVNERFVPKALPEVPKEDKGKGKLKFEFIPCPTCSKGGKVARHTAEFCWNGLPSAEKKKRQNALPPKRPRN